MTSLAHKSHLVIDWIQSVKQPRLSAAKQDNENQSTKQQQYNRQLIELVRDGTALCLILSKVQNKFIAYNRNPRGIDFMEHENLEIFNKSLRELPDFGREADIEYVRDFDATKLHGISVEQLESKDILFGDCGTSIDPDIYELVVGVHCVCEFLSNWAMKKNCRFKGPHLVLLGQTAAQRAVLASRRSPTEISQTDETRAQEIEKMAKDSRHTPKANGLDTNADDDNKNRLYEMKNVMNEVNEYRQREMERVQQLVDDKMRREERRVRTECKRVENQLLKDIESEHREKKTDLKLEMEGRERDMLADLDRKILAEEQAKRAGWKEQVRSEVKKELETELNAARDQNASLQRQMEKQKKDHDAEREKLLDSLKNRDTLLEELSKRFAEAQEELVNEKLLSSELLKSRTEQLEREMSVKSLPVARANSSQGPRLKDLDLYSDENDDDSDDDRGELSPEDEHEEELVAQGDSDVEELVPEEDDNGDEDKLKVPTYRSSSFVVRKFIPGIE